jgi:hypothetical protein
MRFLRTVVDAFAATWAGFDLKQIVRWAGIGLTVAATAVAVVLASFVAVALGLT